MADDWQQQLAKLYGSSSPKEDPPKKNYLNKKSPPKKSAPTKTPTKTTEILTETATAPYNFVSLPEKILPSEISSIENFKDHVETCATLSGEIQIEIETLTPLFLGGNAEKSFAPVDKFIISGSSLRGMFKNIFKIVTCGAFRGGAGKGEDFNNEHIYYRCLVGTPYAWMEDLNKTYNSRMTGDKGKNARPGFLIKTTDNKYFIAPLLPNVERKNNFVMMKDFQADYRNVALKDSCVFWDFKEKRAYILTGNQWETKSWKLLTRKQYDEFRESLKGLNEKARTNKIRETNHGKQIIRFINLGDIDWSKRIELPDEVLISYEHDRNRGGVNLIKQDKDTPKNEGILNRDQLKKLFPNLPADVKTLIACHYLEDNNKKVEAFGHGQCFRIPYKNSIGDIVPADLQSEKIIDFADAVFGRKENWASRVAFEDAVPTSTIETLPTATAHPLMQPNPSSYQLYLKQDKKFLNNWKHWELDKNILELRGYKLYWHNANLDWQASKEEKKLDAGKSTTERLTKDLTLLKVGSKFQSKIRFQNLSAVELGALLMIFDLDGAKSPAYKIGMGKPFGLGSIKVNHKLFLESDDAYTEIFDSTGFKNPYVEVDNKKYLDAFKKYVGDKKMLQTWQKIMDELNAILDWDKKPAPKNIEPMGNVPNERGQMDLDERLKQRAPLPTIFEVMK